MKCDKYAIKFMISCDVLHTKLQGELNYQELFTIIYAFLYS